MIKSIVITGDIVNSRKSRPDIWLDKLKETLSEFGKENKVWEIYRGDSFQLVLRKKEGLKAALMIKSGLKSIGMDARISIGLGNVEFNADKVTESNGSAFVNSGKRFETLKKETLGIQTDNQKFNRTFGVMLSLVDFIISSWKPTTSEVIYVALKNPELNQSELAKMLHKKSQGTISAAMKRAGFDEIQKVLELYETEIQKI